MPNKSRRAGTRRLRKDRVLQARIPSHLDEELRERAEQLGLSVSTVVRNVLLHTFDLVEGVVADSAEIARVIQKRQTRPLPAPARRARRCWAGRRRFSTRTVCASSAMPSCPGAAARQSACRPRARRHFYALPVWPQ